MPDSQCLSRKLQWRTTGALSHQRRRASRRSMVSLRRMDGFFGLGPISAKSTPVSRWNEEKLHHRDPHHLIPRLTRTRSLPMDQMGTSPPGQSYQDMHRRDLLALGLVLGSAQFTDSASAGQSNSQLADEYYDRTSKIVGQIKRVLLETDVTASDNLGNLESFKKDVNAYVADYRRIVSPAQKSFAEVYGVITAVTGHFTSFGLGNKPFPAKLKEKNEKRLSLAETLLQRELARERKQAARVA